MRFRKLEQNCASMLWGIQGLNVLEPILHRAEKVPGLQQLQ